MIDVDDEMNFRMINTQSTISSKQIMETETGAKLIDFIKGNKDILTAASEKVIIRKCYAIYDAFKDYFNKLSKFPKSALIPFFRKRGPFSKYVPYVMEFIQKEKYSEVGVKVKVGIENLWFFLTPYIRDC